MFNPIPLKKVFSRDAEMICEITNATKAKNRKRGFDSLNASFRSFTSTFLDTRYRDNPVIDIFNRSLTSFQLFVLSIKDSSNLVSFSVSSFKVGTYVNFS